MEVSGNLGEETDSVEQMVKKSFLFSGSNKWFFLCDERFYSEPVNEMIHDLYLFLMCFQQIYGDVCHRLAMLVQRIMEFIPVFEALRPPKSGMQALCGVHWAIDRAKLFLQRTANSSKLYLVTASSFLFLSICRAEHQYNPNFVTNYQNNPTFCKQCTRISLTSTRTV